MDHNALYGLQHAELGIIVLDSHRRVLTVSPVAAQMVGLQADGMTGQTLEQIHPHGSTARIHALLDAASQGHNDSRTSFLLPVPGRLLVLKAVFLVSLPGLTGGCYLLSLLDTRHALTPDTAPPPAPAVALLKIPVETPQGALLIDPTEVLFLKASGRYAEVKTLTGRPRLCNLSLKELEERLDPQRFLRVHRAYLVNVTFAAGFRRRGDSCELDMADQPASVIPIGRSRVQLVRDRLGL